MVDEKPKIERKKVLDVEGEIGESNGVLVQYLSQNKATRQLRPSDICNRNGTKDQWEPGGVDMEGQNLPKNVGTTGSTLIEDTGPRVDRNRVIRGSARDRRPIQ